MKKLTLLQILTSIAIAIFIASCSSAPKANKSPKTYSPKTQKEFEVIEKGELHPAPATSSTIKPPPRPPVVMKEVPREVKKEPVKDIVKEPGQPAPVSTEANDISQLSSKNQERLQEINQNLAFFCMKHRKDSTFQDEEHCLAFTKKVLLSCEKKHKLINTIMVNCIKEQLKKR